jgi:hypothetical protein
MEGDWWAWCSPDVVDGDVEHFALDYSGASEVRKLGKEAGDRSTATDDLRWGSASWQLGKGQITT